MNPNPASVLKRFDPENVIVVLPGPAIQAEKRPLPALKSMPAIPGEFQPFRRVINLKFVDPAQPEKVDFTFDPPVEIRIGYSSYDLRMSSNGTQLKLAYWNGARWIPFTIKENNFRLETGGPGKGGGWGIVSIASWSDPTIAWGR
jgi:hypothetical protein